MNELNISLTNHQDYFRIKVDGLLTQQLRKSVLIMIRSYSLDHGLNRVLVDLLQTDFNPDEPMVGALDLIEFMKSIGIDSGLKMAFLYDEAHTERKYFEAVADMQGYRLRYFMDERDAVAWLLHELS